VSLPGKPLAVPLVAAVRLDAGEGQWSLYWTMRGQPVPCRLVPVLVGWADLDRRETRRGHRRAASDP